MHVANALHAPVHLPVVVKAPKPLAIVQATTTRETLIPHPKPNPKRNVFKIQHYPSSEPEA